MSDHTSELMERSGGACEICEATADLSGHPVDGAEESVASGADAEVLLCGLCASQLPWEAELDRNHLYALQGSAWSPVPAVAVTSWRLLKRLEGETWAADLLEQLYLEEEVLAWAERGLPGEREELPRDSNGAIINDGDSVTLIKDLVVKGANFTAKRGTMVKRVRVGDDPTHVEGRVNGMSIMLKCCFLKRAQ